MTPASLNVQTDQFTKSVSMPLPAPRILLALPDQDLVPSEAKLQWLHHGNFIRRVWRLTGRHGLSCDIAHAAVSR
jgi:hypothetical protein